VQAANITAASKKINVFFISLFDHLKICCKGTTFS
jgi:hypothetical protein